ncbi:Gfo/Idh/MocA family protein [Rhizobium halophytocola]|uniref:Dehydrogenase n=1 Tax=Rhizobium halophytocola TaxID=735519 RepID=A0ABS4E3G3_9HYPH|nr:Gfo/Idh/MocA family oxidoreductase [Rhizobium halophytocola]MBP1852467.1 putative dehydrogenase [Rhizobium halophytocola]
MARTRVGIIGLGMAAGHHARSLIDLKDEVEVVAAFSPTEARRSRFCEQYGLPVTGNVDDIFDADTVDAVLILTPPNTHLELVERAAAVGQHILLEKPLDVSLERAKAIVSAADEAGVLLSIVFQNRFRSSYRTLEALLRSGELGTILEASASIRNWRPQSYYDEPGRGTLARDGGGVLLTQGIHTIDLLLNLAGQPQDIAAFARTTPVHTMETEDLVSGAFAFENGASGTLMATTCAYPGYPERIELICTRGTAVLTGDSLEAHLRDGRAIVESATGSAGFKADPMAFGHELHRALIADFLAAVRGQRPPMVSGNDALRAHTFIDAILASGKR